VTTEVGALSAGRLGMVSSVHGWLGVVVARKADLNWKLKISNNRSVRLDWGGDLVHAKDSVCM